MMHARPSRQTVQALFSRASDPDEGRPGAGRLAGYDVVRIVLGLVLLTAAALKGYQLATELVVESGLLTSRWFLIGVVEFELFFGLWLLAKVYPRSTSTVALRCFSHFTGVPLLLRKA